MLQGYNPNNPYFGSIICGKLQDIGGGEISGGLFYQKDDSAPTVDKQLANKKYVDSTIGATDDWDVSGNTLTPHTSTVDTIQMKPNSCFIDIKNANDSTLQIENTTSGKVCGLITTGLINGVSIGTSQIQLTTSSGTIDIKDTNDSTLSIVNSTSGKVVNLSVDGSINGQTLSSSQTQMNVSTGVIDIKHANDSTLQIKNSTTSKVCNVEIDGSLTVYSTVGTSYHFSIQSSTTDNWMEILNSSGAGKGVFFGITTNDFQLYNWQGGPISFFTYPTASNGTERMRIPNNKNGIMTDYVDELTGSNGVIISGNTIKSNSLSTANSFTIDIKNANDTTLSIQNSTSAKKVDVDLDGNLYVDTIGEKTSTNGVYIDSVRCKDGRVYNDSTSAPGSDPELANKKYVDDQLVGYVAPPDLMIQTNLDSDLITGIVLSASSAWRMTISAGTFYNNGSKTIFGSSFDSNGSGKYFNLYYNNTGGSGWVLNTTYNNFFAFITYYNDTATGLANMTAGYYCFLDVYRDPATGDGYAVMGDDQFQYVEEALNYAHLTSLPSAISTYLLVGRYVYNQAGSNWAKTAQDYQTNLRILNGKTRIGSYSYGNTIQEPLKIKPNVVGTIGKGMSQMYGSSNYVGFETYCQGSNQMGIVLGGYVNDTGTITVGSSGGGMMQIDMTDTGFHFYMGYNVLGGGSAPSLIDVMNFDWNVGTPKLYASPIYNNTASARDVYVDASGLVGYSTSLREAKIETTIPNNWDYLYQLRPMSFYYKKKDENGKYIDQVDDTRKRYGLIAEEVELLDENLCYYDDTANKNDPNGTKTPEWKLVGVQYSSLITPMIKKIQEQKKEIDSMKILLTSLNNSLASLTQAFNNYVIEHS